MLSPEKVIQPRKQGGKHKPFSSEIHYVAQKEKRKKRKISSPPPPGLNKISHPNNTYDNLTIPYMNMQLKFDVQIHTLSSKVPF